MQNITKNTINKIIDWKEKNRLTDEDFENAGFIEVIEIIKSQDSEMELHVLEEIQKYQLELGINDEFINDKILVMKVLKTDNSK